MGGGQNEAALLLMKQAAEKGQWLCLKNIHLVTSWLPIL
jgi:dynein heavy chain 2